MGVTIIIKVSLGITHTSQGRRTLQFIRTRLGLSDVLFRVFDSEFISPMRHLYSLIGREPLFTPVLQKKKNPVTQTTNPRKVRLTTKKLSPSAGFRMGKQVLNNQGVSLRRKVIK